MSADQYYYDEYNQHEMQDYGDQSTGHWADYCAFFGDESALTAMEFDEHYELLWSGSQQGRLTSYLHNGPSEFQKYSSFMAHSSPIVQILNLPKHILSVSESTVRLHTRGGLSMYSFDPILADYHTDNTLSATCGTLFVPSGGLMTSEVQKYLFLGTSGSPAHVHDLNAPEMPVVSYDVLAPTSCVQSSITFLTVGGGDGKIRLLDPSLRSNAVLHTLEAHTGGVSSVSAQWDGMTMVTTGCVGTPINPFDPNSPRTLRADPLVKVFDMRMLRQRAPLSLAIPPPNNAKFLPSRDSGSGRDSLSLLVSSANGYLQTIALDSNHEPLLSTLQMCYATLATDPQERSINPQALHDSLSVLATSSSGSLIASGTSMGATSLHVLVDQPIDEDGLVHVSINAASENLSVPPSRPPRPPISPHIDTPNLGTSLVFTKQRPSTFESRVLLSSFNSTPRLLKSQLKFPPRQKILPNVLKEATFQDYIGSIKNTQEIPPNSMLCRKVRHLVYDSSDPRLLEKPHSHLLGQHHLPNPRSYSVGSASSNDSDPHRLLGGLDGPVPPGPYRRVRSHRGRHRMQMFNYSAFNSTPFVGLENSTPNSWANPILQVLFAIPSIRTSALATQLSTFHHRKTNTLFAEVGFLFDMMLSIGESSRRRGGGAELLHHRVATASNFHRALKASPEAVAVGLFDSTKPKEGPSGEAVDGSKLNAKMLQNKVQIFCRFLLNQLSTEHVQESRSKPQHDDDACRKSDAVDNTFSFEANTSTVFLQSGSAGSDSPHKSLTLELSYPTPKQSQSPPTFSEVFHGSLTKTTTMRGWCAASEAYEPFQQTRRLRPASIRDVFSILCGETVISGAAGSVTPGASWTVESLWRGKNQRGGAWLPSHIEVMFLKPEGASAEKDGTLFVSERLEPPRDGTHTLGALSETEEVPAPLGVEEVWVIYDGRTRTTAAGPASSEYLPKCSTAVVSGAVVTSLKLFGVVSGVNETSSSSSAAPTQSPDVVPAGETGGCHAVLHMCTGVGLPVLPSPKDSRSSSIDTDFASEAASTVLDELIDRVTMDESPAVGDEWTLFNDFAVSKSSLHEATHFSPWRIPCVLFFTRCDKPSMWPESSLYESLVRTKRVSVPPTVLNLPSLSSVSSVRLPQNLVSGDNSGGECLIAFDAEFVSVEVENVVMDSTGQRIVHDEGRQVVGRVSLLDGRPKRSSSLEPESPLSPSSTSSSSPQSSTPSRIVSKEEHALLLDDYVLPTEPVVDYVTRFSGLVEEDLNPATSRHAVVTDRTAYLKLRYFLDSGCVFVGHGLQKDFETANIFVPPEQIRDTVELWRLPNMRKISLRFLASYILKMEIQDDIHDSIEDARTALLLYRHYEELRAAGASQLQSTLNELYSFGSRTNWTIGLDRISVSPTPMSRKNFGQHPPRGPSAPDPQSYPSPPAHHQQQQRFVASHSQPHHPSLHHPYGGVQHQQHYHQRGGGGGYHPGGGGGGRGRGGRGQGRFASPHHPPNNAQYRNQYY